MRRSRWIMPSRSCPRPKRPRTTPRSRDRGRSGPDPPRPMRSSARSFRSKYADAAEISEIVTPILSPGAQLATYPRTNSLLITDTSANIRHLAQVIRQLDVEGSQEKVSAVPAGPCLGPGAERAGPADSGEEQGGRRPPTGRIAGRCRRVGNGPRVLPDERTNSLIVIANEQDARDRRRPGRAARYRAAGRHGQRPRGLPQERRRQ